jgi:hypothetical protein
MVSQICKRRFNLVSSSTNLTDKTSNRKYFSVFFNSPAGDTG